MTTKPLGANYYHVMFEKQLQSTIYDWSTTHAVSLCVSDNWWWRILDLEKVFIFNNKVYQEYIIIEGERFFQANTTTRFFYRVKFREAL